MDIIILRFLHFREAMLRVSHCCRYIEYDTFTHEFMKSYISCSDYRTVYSFNTSIVGIYRMPLCSNPVRFGFLPLVLAQCHS